MCLGKCLQTEVIQQYCFLLAVVSAEHSCQAPSQTLIRQTVRKLKKSFENRLNDSTSPIGVRNNNKNDLVFSHTPVGRNANAAHQESTNIKISR